MMTQSKDEAREEFLAMLEEKEYKIRIFIRVDFNVSLNK